MLVDVVHVVNLLVHVNDRVSITGVLRYRQNRACSFNGTPPRPQTFIHISTVPSQLGIYPGIVLATEIWRAYFLKSNRGQ